MFNHLRMYVWCKCSWAGYLSTVDCRSQSATRALCRAFILYELSPYLYGLVVRKSSPAPLRLIIHGVLGTVV